MPPLSTIEEIKGISNVEFSPEELSNVIVIVDGQGFTYSCLINFCKLLEEAKIDLQLIEEVSWLTSLQNSRVNVNSLNKMTELLQQNPASSLLKIGVSEIRTDDLSTLIGDRWLSQSVIQVIADIINQGSAAMGLNLLVTFANDIDDPHNLVLKIKSVLGANTGRIIFYLFVGKSESSVTMKPPMNGETDVRNHFSSAVHNLENDKIIYADTNGWPAPRDFFYSVHTVSFFTPS